VKGEGPLKGIDERIAALSPAQLALLFERLGKAPAKAAPSAPPVPRRRDSGRRPLSFAQERLWFLDQLAPGRGDYNVAGALRLRGAVKVEVCDQALREVVRRHEVLRAGFGTVDGRPLQSVEDDPQWAAARVDLSGLAEVDREMEAERLARAEALRPFDLARAPLLRVVWLRLAPSEHILIATLHHIVCDGWSIEIITGELVEIYPAFVAGQPSALAELAIQYADYADWQRQQLGGERLDRMVEHWRRQLQGAPATIDLRGPAPAIPGDLGDDGRPVGEEVFTLGGETSQALWALGQQEGATPFMVLAALFGVLLHTESGQEDLCLGANVAQRAALELEALVGFFVNQVVLRLRPRGTETFRELLRQVRGVVGEAHAQGDLPFERLVEALGRERSSGAGSLFQAKVDFLDAQAPSRLPGLELAAMDLGGPPLRCDLLLLGWGSAEEISCSLSYDRGRFGAEAAARLAAGLASIGRTVAGAPDIPLREVSARIAREEALRRSVERERLDRLGATRLRSTRRRSVRV